MRWSSALLLSLAVAAPVRAQSLDVLVHHLGSQSAVTGMEDRLARELMTMLPGSTRDRAGNVVLVRGSGSPARLAICPMDEVGYVVGSIRPDGYLALRRVGGTNVGPLYDQFLEGQRVTVFGRNGPVEGVVGVKSTHLTRGRPADGDPAFTLDNAWVDVGASSAAQVAALGIRALSPVTRAKRVQRYGAQGGLVAAPWIAQRAACAALVSAAARAGSAPGTTIIAFAARRHFNHDGAAYLMRTFATADAVMVGVSTADTTLTAGDRPLASWGLATRYAHTPVETVAMGDVGALEQRLAAWLGSTGPAADLHITLEAPRPVRAPDPLREASDVVAALTQAYGPSGHEDSVRALVLRLLPSWAAPTTDTAGNVWVWAGPQSGPVNVLVAHLDEIGFEVTGIRRDGQLTLRALGGFFPSLFEAEPAIVHTRGGMVNAVFTLRDSVGAVPRRTPASTAGQAGAQTQILVRVDPGTLDSAATASLGIRVGDVVTMPKQYVRLANGRATARSFDDRVGCASLVLALRHLDRAALRHRVLFVFSTREEIGLLGARAVANQLGTDATRVYAIDTFVSADAPLETKNFANAPIGAGAVARAVDNSSVTPPALVDTLVALAARARIPLQVGTTNGGNDGSMFTRWGVPDIAIGWPLRYSHSPAEVIDLRDLVSLANLARTVAERW